jgi:PAS domain-containing protein
VLPDDHERTSLLPEPGGLLPDAVYRLDRSWQISHVNFAVETLLDRPVSEVIGRHVLDAFPGVRGTVVEESLAGVLTDGLPRVFQYHHQPWDHFFEVRVYPDSQGVTVAVRDIDERLRAERARDAQTVQLSAVLETLPSATVLVEGDGTILTANRAWVANGELLRGVGITPGGVGDDYLASMARGLDPADHAAIVAGLHRLTAPDSPPTGTFDYE